MHFRGGECPPLQSTQNCNNNETDKAAVYEIQPFKKKVDIKFD